MTSQHYKHPLILTWVGAAQIPVVVTVEMVNFGLGCLTRTRCSYKNKVWKSIRRSYGQCHELMQRLLCRGSETWKTLRRSDSFPEWVGGGRCLSFSRRDGRLWTVVVHIAHIFLNQGKKNKKPVLLKIVLEKRNAFLKCIMETLCDRRDTLGSTFCENLICFDSYWILSMLGLCEAKCWSWTCGSSG